MRDRRGDRRRGRARPGLRGAATAHPSGRQSGADARREDTGVVHRVRPARARRRRPHRADPSASVAPPWSTRWPARGPSVFTSPRRPPTTATAAAVVLRVRGRRASTASSPNRLRSPISRTSASCSRSSTCAPPTAWSPVTGCTSRATTPIGSLLLGLYKDDGTLASVGVIGAFPMATRRQLFTDLQPLVTTFDEHPWNWAAHEAGATHAPQERGFALERGQGPVVRSVATRAGGRGALRPHGRRDGSATPRSSTGGGPTATRGRAPTTNSISRLCVPAWTTCVARRLATLCACAQIRVTRQSLCA